MTATETAARLGLHRADREDREAAHALADFRRRCADPYWAGRCVEALVGIVNSDGVLDDFREAAEGDAVMLAVPETRAGRIASDALEGHHQRASAYLDSLARAVRFAPAGAEDAAARRVDQRFGGLLAPGTTSDALGLHFGAEMTAERLDRWRALIAAMSMQPRRRAA